MMEAKEIVEMVKGLVKEVNVVGPRRIFAAADIANLREILRTLRAKEVQHICDITGIDLGQTISLTYRFDCRPVLLNLKIELPKENPKIMTITDIFPGATLFERDVMEMLGVKVDGHPDPRRLFLPDDWPEGVYPLRKEAKS